MKLPFIIVSVLGIFIIAGALPAEAQRADFNRPFEIQDDGMRIFPRLDALREERAEHAQTESKQEARQERKDAVKAIQENRAKMTPEMIVERQQKNRSISEERKAQMEIRREQARERLLAGTQVSLTEENKPVVTALLQGMFNRFSNTTALLQRIQDRISANIALQTENGKDMSEAQAALDAATIVVEDTAATIKNTQEILSDAIENETEISKEALRELVTETKDAIKKAHQVLIEVIRIIKQS